MNFDEMLETWRTQNTAPSFDVNLDALRQALQAEEARVQKDLRTGRRMLWIAWVVAAGLTVFAGFWIAITISNGWPAIYLVTSGVSFAMFALGVGAMWKSRVPRADLGHNFGNTLQEEVRRSLVLVDHQLSFARHLVIIVLGAASIFFGAMLFNWTLNNSQGIANVSPNGWGMPALLVVLCLWGFNKTREEMREEKPRLERRQRHLRELLAALDDRE
jgi:hypothetical protein